MNLEMRNEIELSKLETVELLYRLSFSCLFCFPFVS